MVLPGSRFFLGQAAGRTRGTPERRESQKLEFGPAASLAPYCTAMSCAGDPDSHESIRPAGVLRRAFFVGAPPDTPLETQLGGTGGWTQDRSATRHPWGGQAGAQGLDWTERVEAVPRGPRASASAWSVRIREVST